jgi:hypothetical protein
MRRHWLHTFPKRRNVEADRDVGVKAAISPCVRGRRNGKYRPFQAT